MDSRVVLSRADVVARRTKADRKLKTERKRRKKRGELLSASSFAWA